MTTVFTVVGVTQLIYTVLERDYGVPNPTGGGSLGSGITTTAGLNQAQVQAIVDAAIANLPAGGAGGVTAEQVDAAIEQAFVDAGPAIQAAVASQVGKLTDRATFNVSTAGDGVFVVETNNLTGAQPKVGIDFVTQRDGVVSVNGKRVLTEDDALNAGSVDAVAINNQLQLLQSRIDDLESENTTLKSELAKKATTDELNQKFNYLNDQSEATSGDLLAMIQKKADQAKLQELVEHVQSVQDELNGTIGEVVQHFVEELDPLKNAFAMFGSGAPTDAVTEFLNALNSEFGALKDQVAALLPVGGGNLDAAALAEVRADVQAIFDVFAEQAGGTVQQLKDFYTNLTQFLLQTMQAAGTYAKLTDSEQIITAKSLTVGGVKFTGSDEVLVPIDDEYGNRLRVVTPNMTDPAEAGIVVVHTDLNDLLAPAVRSLAAGVPKGVTIPENVDWTATVLTDTSYVGLVEFRCINGTVQFRGSLKGPSPTAGTYKAVRSLTTALMDYKPVLEINTTAFAVETGKQYRVAAVRFTTDGRIAISAPTGSFDTIQFDGLSYQVF